MKKHILISLLLITSVMTFGDIGKQYDVTSGLSGNCVRSILQDSIGYMWFATQDGLNRFDGTNFMKYGNSSEKGGFPYLNILSIYMHQDKKRIWVGTSSRLYTFDTYSENFTAFDKKTSTGEGVRNIFSMVYDDDGKLWIATSHGLFLYDEKQDILTLYENDLKDDSSLPDSHVWVVYKDLKGRIWVGTRNGLAKYNAQLDNFTNYIFEANLENYYVCNEIISISQNIDGTLWLGTWYGGIGKFEIDGGYCRFYFGEGDDISIPRIRVIYPLTINKFMIGSDDGLYTFNTTTLECKQSEGRLSKESIYACYKDKEDGIWLGSYFSGITYFSPKQKDFEWYHRESDDNAMSGNVISQFCEDPQGNIWIATEDGGLNLFNPKTKKVQSITSVVSNDIIAYRNIHALAYHKESLWIGTFSKGLYVFNVKTKKTKQYRHNPADKNSIPNDHIYSIYQTKDGVIYLGTLAGFCSYDPRSDSFNSIDTLSNTHVYDIIEDSKDNLWIASKGGGVWKYNRSKNTLKNHLSTSNDQSSLSSNFVIRCYIDTKENLWFCTEGNGISKYNYETNSFERFTTSDNLPNSIIYGMLDDGLGNLWLSSNSGLIRYEPQTKRHQVFTIEDGLQSNQFNFRSSYCSSDGLFYFGGVKGFNCFYPYKLSINKVKPAATISTVYIHTQEEKIASTMRVPVLNGAVDIASNAVSFDILFESLSYVAPSKNRYAYKLDGIHDDWIYTDKNNVTFLNLSPDKYIFRVKASNNDGYWSEAESLLYINILPPFWRSIYAKILYLTIGFCLIYLLFRIYQKKQMKKKEEQIYALEQQSKQELFNAKINFFTQVAHEIKTPISLIKAPLEAITETGKWTPEVEKNLHVIDKNIKRLLDLIRQLLDFRKIEKEGHPLLFRSLNINNLIEDLITHFRSVSLSGISINVSLPDPPLIYTVDQEAIMKIVSNLLSNAMGYAQTNIYLILKEEIKEQGRVMSIIVGDDGVGIPHEEHQNIFEPFYQLSTKDNSCSGVGIGLSLVRLLVDKHDGKVYVNSKQGQGLEICVDIPYIDSESVSPESIVESFASNAPRETIDRSELSTRIDDEMKAYTLLLVEDTIDMANFLEKELDRTYNIILAHNGLEALNYLNTNTVDLIISDIVMPEMDGFALLKTVRSDSLICHIPFILLSAVASLDAKIEGLEYGADAYIEKPFSLNHLKATIDNLLENRRVLLQHFSSDPSMSYDKRGMSNNDVKWLEQVNDIITSNLMNDKFSIDILAEQLAISRSNLQRKMNGLLGMPPNDYVRLIRLKTAGQLLCQGDYRINEICSMVGFNSPSYFTRCFQKQFGILPREFAQKNG